MYGVFTHIYHKFQPNVSQTSKHVIVLCFFDVKKQDVWTTSGILYLCTLCIIISSCGYLYNLRCEAMRWQHLKTAMIFQEDLYWSLLRGTFPVSLRRLVVFSPVAFVPYPWAAFGGGMVRIGAQKGTSSILCLLVIESKRFDCMYIDYLLFFIWLSIMYIHNMIFIQITKYTCFFHLLIVSTSYLFHIFSSCSS